MRAKIFPDAHRDGQDARIAQMWDLSWPLPVPHVMPSCPGCVFPPGRMVVKDWKFHRQRTGSKAPWRCDVRLKCIDCSLVTIYGIAIPEAMWQTAQDTFAKTNQWINWRQGKQILTEAGFFGG